MKKTELIREMIKKLDWLEKQEAGLFKLKLDRKYLNSVYRAGLEILSELNEGRLTPLKEFKALQWKMRLNELIESMNIDLNIYRTHSGIKSLINKLW